MQRQRFFLNSKTCAFTLYENAVTIIDCPGEGSVFWDWLHLKQQKMLVLLKKKITALIKPRASAKLDQCYM